MRTTVGFTVLVALALACGSAVGGTSTGLRGKVMRGPTQPVCYVNDPCEEPARGVRLVFYRSGKVVGRSTTNQKGWYRVTLKPGTWRYVCTVPRHDQLGMAGEFTIKAT